MNILRISVITFLIIALTACAGEQFVRPSGELLQLGTTTKNQVVTVMGAPRSSDWGERGVEKIQVVTYTYVTNITYLAVRISAFYFMDEVLVGHYFQSSFRDEFTDFDLTKVGDIVEDESTRQDVEAILGKPAGEAIYPFTESRAGRLLWYKSGVPGISKEADIELDGNGIVRRLSVKFNVNEK